MKKMDEFYRYRRERIINSKERLRLIEFEKYLHQKSNGKNWGKWGCYLSERQWGTVRENYNETDNSWGDSDDSGKKQHTFQRDQALHRVYRWGEDGIAGISDDHQILCFAVAMWNGKDPCIKERFYGLTNGEGIHGEDVKEYYFYVDNTPTHSYMKYIYKYPYEYKYNELWANRQNEGKDGRQEYELIDTGVFDSNSYFDIQIEYAKNNIDDIVIRINVKNCGNEYKKFYLLPTIWFRNTWIFKNDSFNKNIYWAADDTICIKQEDKNGNENLKSEYRLYFTNKNNSRILFTQNETDNVRAFSVPNTGNDKYYKNSINNYILTKNNKENSIDVEGFEKCTSGTKAAIYYEIDLPPNSRETFELRLSGCQLNKPFQDFTQIFTDRIKEADEFYDALSTVDKNSDPDLYNIQRQAYSGMLWNKQLYNFIAEDWLNGDIILDTEGNMTRKQPEPISEHKSDSNIRKWTHLYCNDIISMPDKWEYPWFATWDIAFHAITLSMIDPGFAKHQLLLLTKEWYMHPNGQMPAYEWNFGNVNPPVHAMAVWKVYEQEKQIYGNGDLNFLENAFDKLNLNYTWWLNRTDFEENNLFSGGFLGLDNIRIVEDTDLEQADSTAWMAMFALNMMKIASELGKKELKRKYMQNFIYICDAINKISGGLWDDNEGFYYDCTSKGEKIKVKSIVGLIPLLAVEYFDSEMDEYSDFKGFSSLVNMIEWYKKNRPDLIKSFNLEDMNIDDRTFQGIISITDKDKIQRILEKVMDKEMFFSDFGIRSLAKDTDYWLRGNRIKYEPAEGDKYQKIMGGNSNWRGPIWFPINYLLVQSLRKYDEYYGDNFKIGNKTLNDIANDISASLINIFCLKSGTRAVYGGMDIFNKPDWQNLILFFEYFNGENGRGLGASHQTGWTGLIANIIQEFNGAKGC